jgi:hypothetical protein
VEPGDLVKRDVSWWSTLGGKRSSLPPSRLFLTKFPDHPLADNPIIGEVHVKDLMLVITVATRLEGDLVFDYALVQLGFVFGWVFADELQVV